MLNMSLKFQDAKKGIKNVSQNITEEEKEKIIMNRMPFVVWQKRIFEFDNSKVSSMYRYHFLLAETVYNFQMDIYLSHNWLTGIFASKKVFIFNIKVNLLTFERYVLAG